MNIEDAKIEDSKKIADLIQKFFGEDYAPSIIDEKIITDKINEENNHFIVAKENNKILGVIRVEKEDMDLTSLRWLCVDEDYRNKGIGTRLVNKALEYLKKIETRKVILRATSDNKEAIEVFKELGFEQEGYFKNHYREGTDIIQMFKFLR